MNFENTVLGKCIGLFPARLLRAFPVVMGIPILEERQRIHASADQDLLDCGHPAPVLSPGT